MKGNDLFVLLLVGVGGYFAYQAWQKQQAERQQALTIQATITEAFPLGIF